MARKSYFKRPTEAQIRNYSSVRGINDNLIENIFLLNIDEAIIIKTTLLPERYPDSRKFMKHGPEVNLPRFKSAAECLEKRVSPVQLRSRTFNRIRPTPKCSYSFKPFTGTDTRKRKVSLDECLQGTELYGYSSQGPNIEVTPYDNAKRVISDGAEIIVTVPSRTKKQSR